MLEDFNQVGRLHGTSVVRRAADDSLWLDLGESLGLLPITEEATEEVEHLLLLNELWTLPAYEPEEPSGGGLLGLVGKLGVLLAGCIPVWMLRWL